MAADPCAAVRRCVKQLRELFSVLMEEDIQEFPLVHHGSTRKQNTGDVHYGPVFPQQVRTPYGLQDAGTGSGSAYPYHCAFSSRIVCTVRRAITVIAVPMWQFVSAVSLGNICRKLMPI